MLPFPRDGKAAFIMVGTFQPQSELLTEIPSHMTRERTESKYPESFALENNVSSRFRVSLDFWTTNKISLRAQTLDMV